ncbi:Altered inheritance of mitochondria protein 9, mitochondrial [Cytospora mali]|uniref:Altered inheritance of mitochondria protein 9, mitochondrial n=1 Tax=Cytospora mali TaxID=578113 RepID=A0A194VGM6_CYTMA|nr:Altered inheritance of mitochondria protein 9, mitochondrial [Valsa mali var. pyri (nom. inval.)]
MNITITPSIDEHVKMALEAYQTDDGTGPEIIQQTIVNTWVGTFIYQFFIKDAHLRQSVIDFVRKHRPGTNPRLGNPYRYGSYNFNIEIVFDDGIALFRFPIPGVVVYPDDKVKAEVATIRYVADHTSIPVPHIYHWGTAGENPTGLHVPFIIMAHIPHTTTVGQALEDPDFTIPSVPDSEKREYFYQQMAEISLQLYNLTSDRVGSLGILENGDYAVTSAPFSHNIAYQAVNCSVPVTVLPPPDKTYSSSKEYFADAANIEVAGLLFMNEKFVESATDCRNKYVVRCLLRDIVRRRQNNTGESDQSSASTKGQTDQPHETFRLWGDDLRPENVLLDENGVVVGVVDWEYTYFAPETYSVNTPWWLLFEGMEDSTDEDPEPGTSDQEKLSHDAENAGDKQSDGNNGSLQEHWDELVRTYLRALEKAEEKLQSKQQARPLGKYLCSGSSNSQAVAAPIAAQLPLSRLMRYRWNEDRKEHALTTSISQGFLLDKFFWDYIDESYWGHNSMGGHEGRLELLNAPSRMLMDWFIYRRVEEMQAWDPKTLLDQVLEQMDGKSSVLVVYNNSR